MTFPVHYNSVALSDLPSSGISLYNFDETRNRERHQDGLIVQVEDAKQRSWVGTFAFGKVSEEGLTGTWSCPSPDQLCVVSKGLGYIVNVKDPLQYEVITLQPILNVQAIRAHDLLVFGDFTCLLAYGTGGVRWKTARLSWDGFTIDDITPEHIIGQGWDPSQEKNVEFRVDIETGQHQGGSFPNPLR